MKGRAAVQRSCSACAAGGTKCPGCAHREREQQPLRRSVDGAAPALATGGTPRSAPRGASGPAPAEPGVPGSVRSTLLAPGAPLPLGVRRDMEARFGQSFGHVRVHTGQGAARSAAEIGAAAYAAGRHIVFGDGRFAPDSPRGRRLLAHELAHVVQQRHAVVDVDRLAVDTNVRGAAERAADHAADRALAGEEVRSVGAAEPRVSRKMVEDEAAGGCGICAGPQVAGQIAHALIQQEFKLGYTLKMMDVKSPKDYKGDVGFVELSLPNSPGDDNGRLDLALVTEQGEIFIGEIKPANTPQLEQGKKDIEFYKKAIKKKLGKDAKPLQMPINLKNVVFPNPEAKQCPEAQFLMRNTPSPEGVYTYFCRPTRKEIMQDPLCRCWKRRKKKEEKKPVDVPVPVRVPKGDAKPVDKGKPVGVDEPVKSPVDAPVPEGEPKKVDQPGKTDKPVEEPGKTGEEQPDDGGKVLPFPLPRPKPVSGEDVLPIAAMIGLVTAAGYAMLKLGGRRVVAPAAAIAAIVLVAQGAEASIGGGGMDPIEALVKNAGENGVNLPPEVIEQIKKDPELKRILTEAAASGDLTEAQRKLGEHLTKTIAENRDQFSDEELEMLLQMTKEAGAAAPATNTAPTVEQIKKAIDNRKKGIKPGTGGQGGGGTTSGGPKTPAPDPVPAPTPEEPAGTPTTAPKGGSPAERLLASMLGKQGGPKFTEEVKKKFLAWANGVQPALTDRDVEELSKHITSGEGKTVDEIITKAGEVLQKVRDARGGKKDEGKKEGADGAGGTGGGAEPDPTEGKRVREKLKEFTGLAPGARQPSGSLKDGSSPVGAFLAERTTSGVLIGGFITVVPKTKLGPKKWKVVVKAGARFYNEGGLFVKSWPPADLEMTADLK